MNCNTFEKWLSAYVDDECSPEKSSAMRGHMHGCPSCEVKASEFMHWKDLAKNLPELEPADLSFQSIQHELKVLEVEDSKKTAWWFAWQTFKPMAPALCAGAVALTALMALWAGSRLDSKVPSVKPIASIEAETAPPGLVNGEAWQDTWIRELKEEEQEYLQAIADLEEDLDGQKGNWRDDAQENRWLEKVRIAKELWINNKTEDGFGDREGVLSLYQHRISVLQEDLLASW